MNVWKVFLECFADYDDVIQVSYGEREILEYTSHKFLEVCWCLSESEWNFYIFIFTEGQVKCHFGYR